MPTTRFIALLGLAAAFAGTAATPAQAAKPAGPILKIESKTCNVGTGAADRNVVLTASAVLRDAGDEVQMRFTVQQRPTTKSVWRSVFAKVGDLGTWVTSEPGADGLRYTKTINGLAQGMQYRVVVDARGVNDAGKVVTKTSKRTYTCIQPQISPDLILTRAVVIPFDEGGLPRVRAFARNAGKETSAPVVVTVRDASTQGIIGQETFEALKGGAGPRVMPVGINGCPGSITVSVQESGADLSTLQPDQTFTLDCAKPDKEASRLGSARKSASKR